MGKTNLQEAGKTSKRSTTEQTSKIISNSGKKYSMVFSILRDTGLRPVELHRTTQANIDLEKGVIFPSTA